MKGYCKKCGSLRELKDPRTEIDGGECWPCGTCPVCGIKTFGTTEEENENFERPDWEIKHIGIEVKRPFEGYDDEIRLGANDGVIQDSVFFWLDSHHWKRMGHGLISFAEGFSREYYFKGAYASTVYPVFTLRALRKSRSKENTALWLTMESETLLDCLEEVYKKDFKKAERSFLILAEPSAIQKLGKLLIEFSNPKYMRLKWSVKGDVDTMIEEPEYSS
jgi:hypothetical protein